MAATGNEAVKLTQLKGLIEGKANIEVHVPEEEIRLGTSGTQIEGLEYAEFFIAFVDIKLTGIEGTIYSSFAMYNPFSGDIKLNLAQCVFADSNDELHCLSFLYTTTGLLYNSVAAELQVEELNLRSYITIS